MCPLILSRVIMCKEVGFLQEWGCWFLDCLGPLWGTTHATPAPLLTLWLLHLPDWKRFIKEKGLSSHAKLPPQLWAKPSPFFLILICQLFIHKRKALNTTEPKKQWPESPENLTSFHQMLTELRAGRPLLCSPSTCSSRCASASRTWGGFTWCTRCS